MGQSYSAPSSGVSGPSQSLSDPVLVGTGISGGGAPVSNYIDGGASGGGGVDQSYSGPQQAAPAQDYSTAQQVR